MKPGIAALLALAAAAAGFAAGASLSTAPPEAPPAPGPGPGLSAAGVERLRAEHGSALAALRSEAEEAGRRASAAEERAAAAEKAAAEAKAALAAEAAAPAAGSAAAAAAARKPSGPRFPLGEYGAVLGDLDWGEIGSSMNSMLPLLKDLADRSRSGKAVDPKSLAKIGQFNAPLVKAALEIGDRIPGSGINAKFTHPVFAVNSMAATLEAAGLPLTDTQAEAVGKLAQEFADRDRARAAGYGEGTWELQKVLDEAGLRDDFFDGAFALFTPEQREALRPEASRGYVGLDLFSSGLLWQQHLLPVFAPDREGAARAVQAQAISFLGVPEERKAALAVYTKEWVDGIPSTWLDGTERLFGQPLYRAAQIEESARVQLAILRRIAEDPALGDGVAEKARKVPSVVFPVKL